MLSDTHPVSLLSFPPFFPLLTASGTAGSALEQGRSSREAVLADANALLACYGVGEESGAELTHAVVELLFTTSIE